MIHKAVDLLNVYTVVCYTRRPVGSS